MLREATDRALLDETIRRAGPPASSWPGPPATPDPPSPRLSPVVAAGLLDATGSGDASAPGRHVLLVGARPAGCWRWNLSGGVRARPRPGRDQLQETSRPPVERATSRRWATSARWSPRRAREGPLRAVGSPSRTRSTRVARGVPLVGTRSRGLLSPAEMIATWCPPPCWSTTISTWPRWPSTGRRAAASPASPTSMSRRLGVGLYIGDQLIRGTHGLPGDRLLPGVVPHPGRRLAPAGSAARRPVHDVPRCWPARRHRPRLPATLPRRSPG